MWRNLLVIGAVILLTAGVGAAEQQSSGEEEFVDVADAAGVTNFNGMHQGNDGAIYFFADSDTAYKYNSDLEFQSSIPLPVGNALDGYQLDNGEWWVFSGGRTDKVYRLHSNFSATGESHSVLWFPRWVSLTLDETTDTWIVGDLAKNRVCEYDRNWTFKRNGPDYGCFNLAEFDETRDTMETVAFLGGNAFAAGDRSVVRKYTGTGDWVFLGETDLSAIAENIGGVYTASFVKRNAGDRWVMQDWNGHAFTFTAGQLEMRDAPKKSGSAHTNEPGRTGRNTGTESDIGVSKDRSQQSFINDILGSLKAFLNKVW